MRYADISYIEIANTLGSSAVARAPRLPPGQAMICGLTLPGTLCLEESEECRDKSFIETHDLRGPFEYGQDGTNPVQYVPPITDWRVPSSYVRQL